MERRDSQYSGGKKYKNDEITVYWKPSACVHASNCYMELIEVFDPGRRPWIDLSCASTFRIIEVVNLCPTEALSWKWNDDEKNKLVSSDQLNHIKFRRPELMAIIDPVQEEFPVSVKIMTDGPIVIKGDITLVYNGTQKKIQNSMISICRCGVSDRQPFCDGQHRKIGFIG
jgi:uncharacterized Fe-S cluster protein YjdI